MNRLIVPDAGPLGLIAAQALTLRAPAGELVVATTNVGHFGQFVSAELWTDVQVT
jgi:hypothetical protein